MEGLERLERAIVKRGGLCRVAGCGSRRLYGAAPTHLVSPGEAPGCGFPDQVTVERCGPERVDVEIRR